MTAPGRPCRSRETIVWAVGAALVAMLGAEAAASENPLLPAARQLHESAVAVEPAITSEIEDAVARLEGDLEDLDGRILEPEAIADQIRIIRADELAREDRSTIAALRYIVVFADSPSGRYVESSRSLLEDLESSGFAIDHVRNYWPRGGTYAGVNADLRTASGVALQVQLHTRASYRAVREGRGLHERMVRDDISEEERKLLGSELTDLWDAVPIPGGVLVEGVVFGQDVLRRLDATGSEAVDDVDPHAYSVRWRHGAWIERNDGAHRLHIGGRTLIDMGVIHESPDLALAGSGGTDFELDFRQVRLLIEGRLFQTLVFRGDFEFSSGEPTFADVYVGLTELGPVGTLLFGHVKVPFSFEKQMSRKYMTFMERSVASAIIPDVRDTGLRAANTHLGGRLRWSVGAFKSSDASGSGFGKDAPWELALRLTGLPIRRDGNRKLLHLGAAYFHQWTDGDDVVWSARPESYLADELVATPAIAADQVDIVGLEMAGVLGSFALESEYYLNRTDRTGDSDVRFHGGYAQISWFVTGERRAYDPRFAHFGRVVPGRDFDPARGGWGAWMVAARASHVDLDDRDIRGGIETNASVAVSCYPWPIARASLEYVFAHVNGQGNAQIAQMRFQVEW